MFFGVLIPWFVIPDMKDGVVHAMVDRKKGTNEKLWE